MPSSDLLERLRLALLTVRFLMFQVMLSLLVSLERRDMCTETGVKDVLKWGPSNTCEATCLQIFHAATLQNKRSRYSYSTEVSAPGSAPLLISMADETENNTDWRRNISGSTPVLQRTQQRMNLKISGNKWITGILTFPNHWIPGGMHIFKTNGMLLKELALGNSCGLGYQ